MTEEISTPRRFAVAFSFAGDGGNRDYVREVAEALLNNFDRERLFFDEWHGGKVFGVNSQLKLQQIYGEDADIVVPFFCKFYLEKNWPRAELRPIHELLFNQQYERVFPVRFDMTKIPGVFDQDIFPLASKYTPEEIAALIVERHESQFGKTAKSNDTSRPPRFDISQITPYAPETLLGRESELALLDDAWDNTVNGETDRPRVQSFVAMGGEGKTSLVAHWAAGLAGRDWPGCEAAFAWSFYSQGSSDQNAASADTFLEAATAFFGVENTTATSAYERGRALAKAIAEKRALLILDGLEPLQYPPTAPTSGELKDQGLAALLKGLAQNNRGLCLVTTRCSVSELRAFHATTAPEIDLKRLPLAGGVALLKAIGVAGAEKAFEKLVEDVKGHALTLTLIGSYLRDAHHGDIAKRDLFDLAEANAEEGRGHAFHVMDSYVRWFGQDEKGQRALAILRCLGLFDRPADAKSLEALWRPPAIRGLTEPLFTQEKKWFGLGTRWRPIPREQINIALKRLEDARLVTRTLDGAKTLVSLDAHPLLREYFSERLGKGNEEAFRAAHRILFEHLCKTTPDIPNAKIEDLQPLYAAVAHGCHAGLQQRACEEVYWRRICRGNDFYATQKLGAFGADLGAVACFFEKPWSRVSSALTPVWRAVLLHQAAFRLRALGRLREAVEPMQVSLDMSIAQDDWREAAISASNLSEMRLALGELEAAIAAGAQSVAHADRSGDMFQRMARRTTEADALCQAGRRAEAETLFRAAEAMQAERQPATPLLTSLGSFRYCDLLLDGAERAAWAALLGAPSSA
ncbi:MAG: hypothetical protein WB816_15500, partial [Methylocystis sp.]